MNKLTGINTWFLQNKSCEGKKLKEKLKDFLCFYKQQFKQVSFLFSSVNKRFNHNVHLKHVYNL